MTFLVPYYYNDNYNGLLVALNIKPDVCSLGGYGFGICSLSV